MDDPSPNRRALLLVLAFVAAATGWILFSDRLVESVVPDGAGREVLLAHKEWAAAVASALLLFVVVRRYYERLAAEARERARAEEERTQALERGARTQTGISHVLARVDEGILALDRQYQVRFANPAAAALLRLATPADLLGRNFWDTFPDLARGPWRPFCEHALAAQEPEYAAELPAGGDRWFECRAYPAADGIALYFSDVTASRRADHALRESELRFRRAVEQAPFPVIIHAEDGEVLTLSEAWTRITGYTLADIPTIRDWTERAYGPRAREVQEVVRTLYGLTASQSQGEYEIRCADGSRRVWDFMSAPLGPLPDGRRVLLSIASDVTERNRAAAAVHQSELELRTAVANAPVVLFRIDVDGIFRLSEGRGLQKLGLQPGEVVGRSVFTVYRDFPDICSAIRRALAGEEVGGMVTVGPINFEVSYQPIRAADQTVVGVIGLAVDITERKSLEAQILRSQRLESVGRLAGGIAHDLNNTLAPVMMGPVLLREYIREPEAQEVITAIEESARRGAAIIRQLLTFSRGGGGERVPVHLRHVVHDMLAIIRETFPKNITTEIRRDDEAPPVLGDATQLHQVLMNLCVNARDAMPDGGRLRIELATRTLDAAAAAACAGAHEGRYVLLAVTDTGTGIAPENLDRIFDPFFTTKEVGKGTGLGLSTALGIVRDHGGFLQVRSVVGQGTTFEVYLPATTGEPADRATPAAPAAPRGSGELLLLVDDEEHVRRLLRRALEGHGYHVIDAASATDALGLYRLHQEELRAIITDMAMPGMNGAQFIRSLRVLGGRLPIVALSGLQADVADPAALAPMVQAFLDKPCAVPALLETVHRVLHP